MKKKVTGERIIAAVIDAIFVSIIAIIPTVFYLIPQGMDGLFEMFVGSENPLEPEASYVYFMAVTTIIELIIGIGYFVIVPFKMGGQTIGKKILKIKAINEFGENPSLKQHFLRAVQNWSVYVSAPFIVLIFTNYLAYLVVVGILANVAGLAVIVAFIMLISREDGKGLHDIIAGSSVVSVDYDINKELVESATKMSDWADIVDGDDKGLKPENEEDEW